MIVPKNVPEKSNRGRRLQEPLKFFDLLQFHEMIKVDLIDESDSEIEKNKNFSWNVTKYADYTMKIRLIFEEPLEISSGDANDLLKITFEDTRFIYDFTG